MIAEKRKLFFFSLAYLAAILLAQAQSIALQAAPLVDTHGWFLVLSHDHCETGQVTWCMVLHQLPLLSLFAMFSSKLTWIVHCNRSCSTMSKGKHNLDQEEHLCPSDEWLVVAIASLQLQPAQALVEVTYIGIATSASFTQDCDF